MTKVTIDPATRFKLHNLAEPLQFFDEDGRFLGSFSPGSSRSDSLYEDAEVPVTPEDVRRLLQQPPGWPLVDILAELEKQP